MKKKILLALSVLTLTGYHLLQLSNNDAVLSKDAEQEAVFEPRKLDIVRTDDFVDITAPAGQDALPIQAKRAEQAKANSLRIVEEKRIAEEQRIAEEKRLAEEQRIKEEEARIAKEKEAKRQAELAAQAEKEKQQAKANTSSTSNSSSKKAAPAQQAAAPAPKAARTDGFNFRGYNYGIRSFGGGGGDSVPLETNYIYRWASKPSHYLVEKVSPPGRVIQQVQKGDKITIDGNTYTVHTIKRGVVNDNTAMETLNSVPATVTFQTCENGKGWNGASLLTIWYAS